MKLIEQPVPFEFLAAGATIEVEVEGRRFRVRVPAGAAYGTKLRLGKGNEAVLVKLVPPGAEPVAAPDEVELVLSAEHVTADMVSLLVESTRARQELGGSCKVCPPAHHELSGLDAAEDRVWVIDGMFTTARGTARNVVVTPVPGLPLDFHTHPSLFGGTAVFSETDRESVAQSGRPMLVVGYSLLGPDLVSAAALPLGGLGLAVGLGLKAALLLEASRRDLSPRLLKLGVAARVCLPDGRILPVHLAGASRVRRAFESAAFEVDKVAMRVSDQAGRLKQRFLGELMRRLAERG